MLRMFFVFHGGNRSSPEIWNSLLTESILWCVNYNSVFAERQENTQKVNFHTVHQQTFMPCDKMLHPSFNYLSYLHYVLTHHSCTSSELTAVRVWPAPAFSTASSFPIKNIRHSNFVTCMLCCKAPLPLLSRLSFVIWITVVARSTLPPSFFLAQPSLERCCVIRDWGLRQSTKA